MKRLFSFVICFVLLVSTSVVVYASNVSISDVNAVRDTAMGYESNIVDLICGGSWEFPSVDSDFTPDVPKGAYSSAVSQEVSDKYATYLEMSSSIGLKDSGYTYADLEVFALTKSELVSLSSVSFSYYYDYRSTGNKLIQWVTIDWVDGARTSAYVVWSSATNVREIRVY